MAILKDKDFEVMVNFGEYKWGWIYYKLEYLYKSKPIYDYSVYPKENLVSESYKSDKLIIVLEDSEKNNHNNYWETDEPYISIEINYYPVIGWEDVKDNKNVALMDEKEIFKLKQIDEEREQSGGKFDNDCFELLFLIGQPMSASGPAFKIKVTRVVLNNFIIRFKKEYEQFLKKNKNAIKALSGQNGPTPPVK
jgi:hypothetical protein